MRPSVQDTLRGTTANERGSGQAVTWQGQQGCGFEAQQGTCDIIFGCRLASSTEAASRSRSLRSIAIVTTCKMHASRMSRPFKHRFASVWTQRAANAVQSTKMRRCAKCHSALRRLTHQLDQDVSKAGLVQLRQAPHYLTDLRADVSDSLRSLAIPSLLITLV